MNPLDNHSSIEGASLSPHAAQRARLRQIDPDGVASALLSVGVGAIVLDKLLELQNQRLQNTPELQDGDAE